MICQLGYSLEDSVVLTSIGSLVKMDKKLKTKRIRECLCLKLSFKRVALEYLYYAFDIHFMVDRSKVGDRLGYKEKFVEVMGELMQLLERFSRVARLDSLEFKSVKSVSFKLTSVEAFLDFDKFADYYRQVREAGGCHCCKSQLSYDWNSFGVEEFLQQSGCSSSFLEQLRDQIKRKRRDLTSKIVSRERVEELSFTFFEPMQTDESVAADGQCSICLKSFVVDQKVSRMPCGDLFHKGCIARWFNSEYISEYISAFRQVKPTPGYKPKFKFAPLRFLNHYANVQTVRDNAPKFQCPNCERLCC